MGKTIDNLLIAVCAFVLVFALSATLSHNSIIALIAGIIVSIMLLLSIMHIGRSSDNIRLNTKNYDTYMIVMGYEYQLGILSKLYPDSIVEDKYIVRESAIIMPFYKFGALSNDDILKAYNATKSHDKSTVYIISNNIERGAISFATKLYDVTFHFVRSKDLYSLCKANSLLPTISKIRRKTPIPIHDIIGYIFSRSNAPRYLFTSITLLLVGMLTPIRGYYMALSALSAILCLVSIFSKDKLIPNSKLPPINIDKE